MSQITGNLKTIVAELGQCLGAVSASEVDRAVTLLDGAPRVFLAGAGRSGLAIRAFAMRLMHLGLNVHLLGDTTTPAFTAADLLVIGSGSGRTASLLASAQKARQLGGKIVLVTIDPGSPIGQLADATVRVPAPSPKATDTAGALRSIQPMGSLFEQSLLLLLDAMIIELMTRRKLTSDTMFERHANLE
jgi:6-phospho-3-hexuloisomerase